jgi:hypothetical protein
MVHAGPVPQSIPQARLKAVLGAALDQLTADNIDALVAASVREDSDLDFKEGLYGTSDADKRDLAGDVAALANAAGGALILGVAETDGAATAAPGVTLSEAEVLRMQQILASNVAPHCVVRMHRVERTSSDGFFVIEIPRSAEAPHAVRVGNALRYPRRDGLGIRWLSESELADTYRDRFARAKVQVESLREVHSDGLRGLKRMGWEPETSWIAFSLVPDEQGSLELRARTPGQLAHALRDRDHPLEGPNSGLRFHEVQGTTGLRRVVVSQGTDYESGRATVSYWQLHTSGSGFGALSTGYLLRDTRGEVLSPPRQRIDDEQLVINAAQALDALVDHAVTRCGASGLGVVRATIESWDEQGAEMPVVLAHGRGQSMVRIRERDESGVIDLHPSEHTVDLAAIHGSATELLIATRSLVTDLTQTLGRPECWQIDQAGALRLPYFTR